MTEDGKIYWAWLQLSLGAGSFKPKRILSYFPDIPSFSMPDQLNGALWDYSLQKN